MTDHPRATGNTSVCCLLPPPLLGEGGRSRRRGASPTAARHARPERGEAGHSVEGLVGDELQQVRRQLRPVRLAVVRHCFPL
jgi:hypothetical protein